MLEQFREFGNKRIVRFFFALFLVIPFGFFGIDYYFRSPVGRVPRAPLDSFIRLHEQTREVSVVNVTPESQLAKVTAKPGEVKAYYDQHLAEFTTPEQARVEYLELSADSLAAQTSVPAEEIAGIYEQGVKSGRFGQREERKASH